jgi:hypothetical protein
MGAIAARRLWMLIHESDGQAWTIVTPCPLVIRDSSRINGNQKSVFSEKTGFSQATSDS